MKASAPGAPGGAPSEFKGPSGVAFALIEGHPRGCVVSASDNISQCLAGLWTAPEEKKDQRLTKPPMDSERQREQTKGYWPHRDRTEHYLRIP